MSREDTDGSGDIDVAKPGGSMTDIPSVTITSMVEEVSPGS